MPANFGEPGYTENKKVYKKVPVVEDIKPVEPNGDFLAAML